MALVSKDEKFLKEDCKAAVKFRIPKLESDVKHLDDLVHIALAQIEELRGTDGDDGLVGDEFQGAGQDILAEPKKYTAPSDTTKMPTPKPRAKKKTAKKGK